MRYLSPERAERYAEIKRVLGACDGSVTAAAAILDTSLVVLSRTLHNTYLRGWWTAFKKQKQKERRRSSRRRWYQNNRDAILAREASRRAVLSGMAGF